MSRFDYPDPGTDQAYCNALVPEPDEDRDDERAFSEDIPLSAYAMDPAADADRSMRMALQTLEVEIAKVSTRERAWVVRRILASLEQQTQRVADVSLRKLDEIA